MLGIMASVFRNATRTDPRAGAETHHERRNRRRHEEERQREREAFDELVRYRRGYW